MERRPLEAWLTFSRRDRWIGLAIVGLAFVVRLIIILNRAHAPNALAAFDPLPVGSDQTVYYSHVLEWKAGTFPPATYFFQPGMSWFMIAATQVMRTDNVGALRVLTAALAALNCGLYVAVAQLAFGRRAVSYLSGLLLAIYPVSAFFDTDFVIVPQATILLTVALFGVLWLWRSPRRWTGAVLYGAAFGALAVTRFETVAIAPVLGLWLIAVRRDWRAVFQVGLAAAVCGLVILPVALHNRAGGADYLITPVGQAEIYRGNNRDASGAYRSSTASRTTSHDYLTYLRYDIQLAPRRFVELELHKIGLFLSAQEPGNNLTYIISGEGVSPLLRAIPLNFQVLLGLALFGLVILARQHHPTAVLFPLAFLALMASILMIWVEARLRTPVVLFMILPAAYAVVIAAEWLLSHRAAGGGIAFRRADWGRGMRQVIIPIVLIVALLAAASYATLHLPRPITANHLPESATRVDAEFDGTLRLVGWEIQENYSRAGVIVPFQPYVVSLYWELLQPTSIDYSFSLGVFVGDERVIAFDHPIGDVAYPEFPTSRWKTGTIYVEHVGLNYRRFDGPTLITGVLLLNVYPERDAEALLPAANLSGAPTHLQLAQPALAWGEGMLPDDVPLLDDPVPFGQVLRLRGRSVPQSGIAGQSVAVVLAWETTARPITRSLIFSVGLLGADGQLVAQSDGPPLEGQLLAISLPTHFAFGDTHYLTLPDQPGEYSFYTLVYEYDSRDRLSVPGVRENLLYLGTFDVLPPE